VAQVVIIEGFDGGAAPSSYQLATGQVIEVLAARALFDGTGASGDFVPQVSMFAQDGRKLGSFPAPETVTAGAIAGCTFFPTAPPSSGGGGKIAQGFEDFSSLAPIHVLAGDRGTFSWAHFAGDSLFDLTTPTQPAAIAAGIYEVTMGVAWPAGYGASTAMFVRLTVGDGLANQWSDTPQFVRGSDGTLLIPLTPITPPLVGTCYLPAGGVITAQVSNGMAVPLDFSMAPSFVKQLA
jgi:hypothetical protein